MNNFSYHLVDLDPTDGITPYITFGPGSSAHAGALLFDNFDWSTPALIEHDVYTHGEVDALNADGRSHAFSFADQVHADVQMNFHSGQGDAYTLTAFTLSPNTQLVFTADAQVQSSFDPLIGAGYAQAQLSGGYDLASGNTVVFSSDLYSNPGDPMDSTTLSAAIISGSTEMTGYVQYYVLAQAVSYVSPIPEPASAAMLVAGLGMLAGAARRRNRRLA